MAEETPKKEYVIPKNYTSFIAMADWIKTKNLTEAIVVTLLLGKLINWIPFVFKIKAGIMGVLCGACFLVFLLGYKEESILTYLVGYFQYKFSCGARRIKIPGEEPTYVKEQEGDEIESYYEKLIKFVKHRRE